MPASPIYFNKPFLTGKETNYIQEVLASRKLSGNSIFTQKCHNFFEKTYNFKKVLLSTSCTTALEMAAILLDIKEGDEVIAPSFTFVSTVNAFVLRGAKIVFADSNCLNPNIDPAKIEELITPKTKVILPFHYAGIACNMDEILTLAKKYNLHVVEDAAAAVDSFYKNIPLGSLGSFATFSFHETKNISSGEGGMLVVNDEKYFSRSEIIWEDGTNRAQFFRGEVDKYEWTDVGSSFMPAEIISAFLFAQLESLQTIQQKRKLIWTHYMQSLSVLSEQGRAMLPHIPDFATNNGHIFYLVCKTKTERTALISFLKENKINSAFHYTPLHRSAFYKNNNNGRDLIFADTYGDCLVRLPMYCELEIADVDFICSKVLSFYIG